MAWSSWTLGATMIIGGGIGLFINADTGTLVGSGTGLIFSVVGIVVGGKVVDDRKKTPTKINDEDF